MLPLVLAACSGDAVSIHTSSSTIKNGIDDTAGLFPAAVRLRRSDGYTCSGAFITDHLILTAAHCFSCARALKDSQGNRIEGCHPEYPAVDTSADEGADGPILDSSATARDGYDPYQGNLYAIDYVWFPRDTDLGNGYVPDVAVVHTHEAFGGTPMAVLPVAEMPTPSTIAGFVGEKVAIVGYSPVEAPSERRRYGYADIVGDVAPVGPQYSHFVDNGEPYNQAGCPGDSGGPVLFLRNGSWKLGGVMSAAGSGGQCAFIGLEAYVPRTFLDAMCMDPNPGQVLPLEWCLNAAADRDEDWIPDVDDNCPDNPNADQTNSNQQDEIEDSLNGGTLLGDACDALPHATTGGPLGQELVSVPSYDAGQTGSVLFWMATQWSEARLFHRPAGYAATFDAQASPPRYIPTASKRAEDLSASYCACHVWQQSTPQNPVELDDSNCVNVACKENGDNSNLDIDKDTGWQKLNWAIPAESASCTRTDIDGDDPTGAVKPFNECAQSLPDRAFHRVFGGAVYCTDHGEYGCQSGDFERFWTDNTLGFTASVEWDWKSQDYPHDPTTIPLYDPAQTSSAKARVWLHPESAALQITHNNAYTGPQRLEHTFEGTLGRPLYQQPLWRWIVPDTPALGAQRYLLAPVMRETGTDQLPLELNWTPIPSTSVTRALVVNLVEPTSTHLHLARTSRYVGDADVAMDTVGFGAAQLDEAIFAVGGEAAEGALSNVLWVGLPSGAGEFRWEVPEGVQAGSLAMPQTQSYAAWLQKLKSQKPISRPSLVALAATIKGTAKGKSGAALKSFTVSNGPPPQKEPLLVASPSFMTLTLLFGQTETGPHAHQPIGVSIYDIYNQQWVSGEIEWPCGPRHSVGHATTPGGEAVVFYGGELDGEPLDGLYLKSLNPELLLNQSGAEHLDDGLAVTPGPRARAVLAYEPRHGRIYLYGGTGPGGAIHTDLWQFSLKRRKWTRLSDGVDPAAPAPMIPAGLVVSWIDGSVVVLGGTYTGSVTERAWRFKAGDWFADTVWRW